MTRSGSKRWGGSSYSRAALGSGPPCAPTPLAAACSLPGAVCPHGSAARSQNPGPIQRGAGFGAPHKTAAEAPPGRGRPGAIFCWRQQLGTLLPTAGPLAFPSGDPTLSSVCTASESLGWPVTWALPSLLPRPRLLSLPTLQASFVAAGTGGCAPDCGSCSASEWVSELSKESCRGSYVELLGLALFSSLDKTQSCLSFGLLSSPLAVGHTRS